MEFLQLQQRRDEAGFTLVELAIVMIIIGLLIGGILKGQELVANAQTTATISQIKGIDGAVSTFRDKYSTQPGDMRAPETRLRDCTARPCNNQGNGDGKINRPANLGTAPDDTQEGLVAFTHLAAADLVSGIDINGTDRFGSALPEAKVGGGFWLGFTTDGSARGLPDMRQGHYIVFTGAVDDVAAGGDAGTTATQAGQIDRKLDDSDPRSGDVQGTGAGCVDGGIYAEADQTATCSLYIRIQG